MSDRRKKLIQTPPVSWTLCPMCCCKVLVNGHSDSSCASLQAATDAATDEVLINCSGVVYRNSTFVANAKFRKLGDSSTDLSFHNTVYIHPLTMRELSIPLFDEMSSVVLINDVVCNCKPDTTLELIEVKLSHSLIGVAVSNSNEVSGSGDSQMPVIVRRVEGPFQDADEVEFMTRGRLNCIKDPTFLTLIQQSFINKFITHGTRLCFKWFTQPTFDLKVVKINGMESNNHSVYHHSNSGSSNFRLTSKTKWRWFDARNGERLRSPRQPCGGYSAIKQRLEEIISNNLKCPQWLHRFRGVLLHGPTGSGKRSIVGAITRRLIDIHWMEIKCTDISCKFDLVEIGRKPNSTLIFRNDSRYSNGGEVAVISLFSKALREQPCVVFIHHIDSVCLRRNRDNAAQHDSLTSTVISAIDTILGRDDVRIFLIATTCDRFEVDSELFASNRLSLDIELTSPTPVDRLDILRLYLSAMSHSVSDSEMKSVADNASSFWAWHIANMCICEAESRRRHLRQISKDSFSISSSADATPCIAATLESSYTAPFSTSSPSDNIPSTTLQNASSAVCSIDYSDLKYGFKEMRKRMATIAVAPVRWCDIGGREDLKRSLQQAIEGPLRYPQKYTEFGVERIKGILLYGPPGCSKTMIAKAIATQCNVNFFAVQGSELLSCYHGESERNIREVFVKARRAAPSIVFFDEIDAIGGARGSSSRGGSNATSSMMQSLLVEMDGVDALCDVIIVAATNRPQCMDKALLRPGRLDRKIYVRLPDASARREIFKIEFRTTMVGHDVNIDVLVNRTDGFSCAEVVHVCNEARMSALRENIYDATTLFGRHFNDAFARVYSSTDIHMLHVYENFERQTKFQM